MLNKELINDIKWEYQMRRETYEIPLYQIKSLKIQHNIIIYTYFSSIIKISSIDFCIK